MPISAHCSCVLARSTSSGFGSGGFACCSIPTTAPAACSAGGCSTNSAARRRILGEKPDGQYEHTPEPTQENLPAYYPACGKYGADIGFCQDPDADRWPSSTSSGRYIGEEYTLALCVDHVLRSRRGPVVTNCSTSRMTEDLAAKYGVPFFRSAVGEANVVEAMQRHGAVLGGEGNGGVIDPRVVFVRDSFVGMALRPGRDGRARREKISRLADELPRYEIVKTKISLAAGQDRGRGLPRWKSISPMRSGRRARRVAAGLAGKWLLVRASNTEPIVRAIAEAAQRPKARRLCDEAAKVLAARLERRARGRTRRCLSIRQNANFGSESGQDRDPRTSTAPAPWPQCCKAHSTRRPTPDKPAVPCDRWIPQRECRNRRGSARPWR